MSPKQQAAPAAPDDATAFANRLLDHISKLEASLVASAEVTGVPPGAAASTDALADGAAYVRLGLALRGRTSPTDLLPPGLPEGIRIAVLDAVARDCDTGAGESFGRWMLADAARRRELIRHSSDDIARLLRRVTEPDDLARVLGRVYGPAPVSLPTLPLPELRILLSLVPALAGIAPNLPDPELIRWNLRSRVRADDYDRIVAAGFVGRERDLAEIVKLLRLSVTPAHQVSLSFLWGTGGVGKSTLVAAAIRELLRDSSPAAPVVAHLDFDRSDLDPQQAIGLSLEVLLQAGLGDPKREKEVEEFRDRMREHRLQSLEFRKGSSREAQDSEVGSLMYGSLRWIAEQGRTLVLVLDTFEQVENAGEAGFSAVRRWINQLMEMSGAGRAALVFSGRSDPRDTGALQYFGDWGTPVIRELKDLEQSPAVAFLTAGRVAQSLAVDLYQTLGGNPLVLRLVREVAAHQTGGGELGAVAEEVRAGKIPRELVQAVLYDRFLKHIDPLARAYAHPGFVLPEITVKLIREVLAPLQSQPGIVETDAQAIFDGLAKASWLVRREGDALVQRPDVRRLMLRLMAADPARGEEVRRVRTAAMLYHHGKPEMGHRAALAYHLLMQAESRADLELLGQVNLTGCGTLLRRHLEDLPAAARTFVNAVDFSATPPKGARWTVSEDQELPAETALAHLPDDLWANYMAGDGEGGGKGDWIADTVDPKIALELWRKRRIGIAGQPPTFVLQSLAETAEWGSDEADLAAVVGPLLQPTRLKNVGDVRSQDRVYWAARLALVAMPATTQDRGAEPWPGLIQLLRAVLRESSPKNPLPQFWPLAALVEGRFQGEAALVEGDYAAPEWSVRCTCRFFLQRALYRKEQVRRDLSMDDLLVGQRDFPDRIRAAVEAGYILPQTGQAVGRQALISGHSLLLAIHGQPQVELTKVLAELNRPVTVRLDRGAVVKLSSEERSGKREPDRSLRDAVVTLLRGPTPELYRPARQALVETFTGADQAKLAAFATRFGELFTILPSDFEPALFARRAAADPATWFLTLVQFADQARVLESVLTDALEFGRTSARLRRVLVAIATLDRSLTGGLSTDWWANQTPLPRQQRRDAEATAVPPSPVGLEARVTATPYAPLSSAAARPDPSRLKTWLSKLQRRDPSLHASLSARLAARTRPITESAMAADPGVLAAREHMALETIVREGRPALLIQNGSVTPVDPTNDELSREVIERLLANAAALAPVIPLVGRIDVTNFAGGAEYLGTGWLVEPNLVVTNRHVAELLARQDGGTFRFRPGRFGDPLKVRLDYRHELNVAAAEAVDVEEVLWIEPDAGKVDIAFLKVAMRSNGLVQDRIFLADSDAEPGRSVAVIGYPARAPAHIIPDQTWMDRIYGAVYDVKRIAPGLMDDPSRGWATHDCTTLGGNSGSVVVDLASGRAVALHFAGLYLVENYAVPASTIRRYLRDRPWHGSGAGTGAGAGTLSGGEAAPRLIAGAGAVTSTVSPQVSVTLPLTISLSLGPPVLPATAGSGSTNTGPAITASDLTTAARMLATERRLSGVCEVRPGFLLQGGRLTQDRCLVVAAHPERLEAVRGQMPASYSGFPVQVRAASIQNQLGEVISEANLTAVQYDDDARKGEGFTFNWVDETMTAVLHVGPERSWSMLAEFLSGAREELVSSMYEFHAAHIATAVEAQLAAGAAMTLVMAYQSRDPKKGTVPDDEFDRSETFERWEKKFGEGFERVFVPVGGSGLVANAYHIKVTVRDKKAIWLSSGNWTNTSQPLIPAGSINNPAKATQAGNREWHAIIENPTLAKRFRNHIRQDFSRSLDLGGEPEGVLDEVYVDVPQILPEAIALEAPAQRILEPLWLQRRIRVKPLLTPDKQGAVFSDAVLRLVKSARKSLLFQNQYISMSGANDGYLGKLVDALLQKADELEDFRMILRSDVSGLLENLEALQDRGLDVNRCVRKMPKTHTKGIIVDGKQVLIGSHNWSWSGVTLNRDASLIFDDQEIAQFYTQAFELDWDRARELELEGAVPTEASRPERAPRLAVGDAPPPGYIRMRLSEYLDG